MRSCSDDPPAAPARRRLRARILELDGERYGVVEQRAFADVRRQCGVERVGEHAGMDVAILRVHAHRSVEHSADRGRDLDLIRDWSGVGFEDPLQRLDRALGLAEGIASDDQMVEQHAERENGALRESRHAADRFRRQAQHSRHRHVASADARVAIDRAARATGAERRWDR